MKEGRTVLIATALDEVVQNDFFWSEDDSEALCNRKMSTVSPSHEIIQIGATNNENSPTSRFVKNILKTYSRNGDRFFDLEGDSFDRKLKLFNGRYTQNGSKNIKRTKEF